MEPPAYEAGPPGLACPNCGQPHEPGQEYCLECGARLPARRTPRVPRSLIAALVALALLGAGGIVAAVVLAGGDGDDEAAPLATGALETTITGPATQTFEPSTDLAPGGGTGAADTGLPPVETTLVPGGTNPTLPGEPTTPPSDPSTVTTPTTPTTTAPSGADAEWPAGQAGYTVIVASILQSQGQAAAEAQAQRARQAGLPQVGILVSSDYSSLQPGYYAVFTGVYSTLDQARSALPAARAAGFPDAYTRRVTP